jgi:hypothetical protein
MTTYETILADRYRDGEDVDPMETDDAAQLAGNRRQAAWNLIDGAA